MSAPPIDSMAAMPTALIYVQDGTGYVGRHVLDAIRARNAAWDRGEEVPGPSDDDAADVTRRLVVYDPAVSVGDPGPDQVVAAADIIVVNLFGDLDEAAALIKAVRAVTLTRPKHVVCLSTALTWAGTSVVPGEDGAGGADETQFRGRQPAAACSRHKLLETLIVNSSRHLMSTAVLAAGIMYGDGEADLHNLFKQAWLNTDPCLPIIGSGTNTLPTIHVTDYATATVRFLERPPSSKPYLLMVDKARDTQQAIVAAVSKMLSTGTTASISELDAVGRRDLIAPHIATADMIIARDTSWISTVQMEWRSEQGLVASIGPVVAEFITTRNLQPIRVAVIGPPGSGRSYWARQIATHFYLPLVSVRDLITKARDAGQDLQLDKNGRAPVGVVAALVQLELQRNEIRNKGYVLDGYPRTSEEARATFTTNAVTDSEEQAAPTDTPEAAAEPAQAVRDVPILPDRVVSVSATDVLIVGRAKENAGRTIPGHSDEKALQRRLNIWNKSVAAAPDNHPRTYFSATMEIMDVNAADPAETVLALVEAYVGGPRPPYNYHPTEEEIAAADTARRERERAQYEHEMEIERQKQEEIERQAQEHARKVAERDALLAQLAQSEAELIADRARPLRQYLGQHVVPVVVEGLYEIARVRPDDPIDYLAEFLFRASTKTTMTVPPAVASTTTTTIAAAADSV